MQMRHLTGVLLAIVLGAALFVAGGWSVTHLTAIAAHGTLISHTGVLALGLLAGTGLFLGIALAARAISPLAPGLPGLALLAWTALLVMHPHRALAWIPLKGESFGLGFEALLVSGVLALLGTVMIIPLFLPSRWRRTRRKEWGEQEWLPVFPAQSAGTPWWGAVHPRHRSPSHIGNSQSPLPVGTGDCSSAPTSWLYPSAFRLPASDWPSSSWRRP